MTRIVLELAAGWPFFAAVAMAILGLAVRWRRRLAWRIAGSTILGAGLVILGLGLPPISPLVLAVAGGCLAGAMVVEHTPLRRRQRVRSVVAASAAGMLLVAAGLEAQWLAGPRLATGPWKQVLVIGDSLAAGVGGVNEVTWPRRLSTAADVQVLDASVAGARVGDARDRQAPALASFDGLVLLDRGQRHDVRRAAGAIRS